VPDNPWLVVRAPVPRPALRLFCLPYAGGNAGAFETWRSGLPRAVEVNAVQYPGRRERGAEPALRRMTPLVQALETALAPHLDRPYALYGDCLGGHVAFELARRLERRGHRPAELLVVSSAVAPHLPNTEPDHSGKDDVAFLTELVALGTMPPAVAAHPDLAAAALPAARADFELGHTYRYRDAGPIGVPVTAIVGDADPHVGEVGVAAWAELTTAGLTTLTVPGGHDLLARADAGLLGAVRSALLGKEPS